MTSGCNQNTGASDINDTEALDCSLDVMVVDKMLDLFGIPVEKTLMTEKACVRGIMEIMIMSMSAAGTLAVTKIYSRLLA